MKPTFDPTKPVQTRGGRKARIVSTNYEVENYPILALIEVNNGKEMAASYTLNGQHKTFAAESADDLVNIPEKRTADFWVNVYFGDVGTVHITKNQANNRRSAGCLACLHIVREYTAGEGLE